jgi:hypothetical protein
MMLSPLPLGTPQWVATTGVEWGRVGEGIRTLLHERRNACVALLRTPAAAVAIVRDLLYCTTGRSTVYNLPQFVTRPSLNTANSVHQDVCKKQDLKKCVD